MLKNPLFKHFPIHKYDIQKLTASKETSKPEYSMLHRGYQDHVSLGSGKKIKLFTEYGHDSHLSLVTRTGWLGGAMVLGKLPVPGRPSNLNLADSRARAYCACSGCGWGLFGHFYYHLSFLSSFSLSLGDGPI